MDSSSSSSSTPRAMNPISLVGTGIVLGIVHVLTGPDHLSALATLSANVPCLQAFYLGIRWGIGHSMGLVLVAVVFLILAIRSQSDNVDIPDRVMHVFETLVGLIMIGLGLYGIQRALQKRSLSLDAAYGDGLLSDPSQNQQVTTPGTTSSLLAKGDNDTKINETIIPDSYQGQHSLTTTIQNASANGKDEEQQQIPIGGRPVDELGDWSEGEEVKNKEDSLRNNKNQYRCCYYCCNCYKYMVKHLSAKTVAVLVGIVHGFAGPGGVLGVIPAIQLKNPKLSALYLTSFCVSSTLAMGCYATLYGMCTSRLASSSSADNNHHHSTKRDFVIECFSAALSIVVGILWLVLLALGKLEDVFP